MLLAYMAPDIFAEWKKGSAETLLLSLLEAGPRHGYELSKLIDDRTGGRLTFHVANVLPRSTGSNARDSSLGDGSRRPASGGAGSTG